MCSIVGGPFLGVCLSSDGVRTFVLSNRDGSRKDLDPVGFLES